MNKRATLRNRNGQGHRLTDNKLVQDRYLRNLRPPGSLGKIYQQEKLDKNNNEN